MASTFALLAPQFLSTAAQSEVPNRGLVIWIGLRPHVFGSAAEDLRQIRIRLCQRTGGLRPIEGFSPEERWASVRSESCFFPVAISVPILDSGFWILDFSGAPTPRDADTEMESRARSARLRKFRGGRWIAVGKQMATDIYHYCLPCGCFGFQPALKLD
jgi:hypothetical protein